MPRKMVVFRLCGWFAAWHCGSGLEKDPVIVDVADAEGLGACFFSVFVIEIDFDFFQIPEEQKASLLQLA
jgi:hypothetical protein